jgi:hypothetical protein
MMKWKLRKVSAAELLNLQVDDAGNLYWRGRRLTAGDYARISLVALLISMFSNVVRMAVDIGRLAGWGP